MRRNQSGMWMQRVWWIGGFAAVWMPGWAGFASELPEAQEHAAEHERDHAHGHDHTWLGELDGRGAADGGTAPKESVYVCPMHPEVRQQKEGRCPKCGMKLVPKPSASSR